MKEKDLNTLWKLYLDGKTSRQEEKILFHYLADERYPDREFYGVMQELWNDEPGQRIENKETAERLNQIWGEIARKKERKTGRHMLMKYAASIVLVLLCAGGWYGYQKSLRHRVPVETLSKVTMPGQKVKLLLPDSSVVYLGGSSRLKWSSQFGKANLREVQLEGEAFFEVKRDTARPFTIRTGTLQTQVLGTSFNIYAYPEDGQFSVAVRTGRVKVSESSQNRLRELSVLRPGMKLHYNNRNRQFRIDTGSAEGANSWVTNRFVFRGESLSLMLRQLERYYNVEFELKNPDLANCRFNATFSNKSIGDVMEQIRIMSSGRIHYQINMNDKKITLWGKDCQ